MEGVVAKTRGKKKAQSKLKGKKRAQVHHAQARLVQRFDVHVDAGTILQLSQYISSGGRNTRTAKKALFYDRKSNRVTRWHVWHEGQWLPVVYDSERKTIVTVLPRGSFGPEPDQPGTNL